MAAEGGLAGVGGVEGVDGGEDEAEVAGDEVDGGVAEGFDDEGHDLGVGGGGVGGGEDLEAGLEVFARAVGAPLLPAPDRAAVGVARGLGAAVRAGVHVEADDGDGEVGAEHHLGTLVAGDEGAGADVLAVEVEEDVGGLQGGGLDAHGAGRGEDGEDARDLGLEAGEGRAHAGALEPGAVGHHRRAVPSHAVARARRGSSD